MCVVAARRSLAPLMAPERRELTVWTDAATPKVTCLSTLPSAHGFGRQSGAVVAAAPNRIAALEQLAPVLRRPRGAANTQGPRMASAQRGRTVGLHPSKPNRAATRARVASQPQDGEVDRRGVRARPRRHGEDVHGRRLPARHPGSIRTLAPTEAWSYAVKMNAGHMHIAVKNTGATTHGLAIVADPARGRHVLGAQLSDRAARASGARAKRSRDRRSGSGA